MPYWLELALCIGLATGMITFISIIMLRDMFGTPGVEINDDDSLPTDHDAYCSCNKCASPPYNQR